jgi:cysteine-rich repeat protein
MRARSLLSFASLTAAALVAACGRPGEFSASSSSGTGSSGDASSSRGDSDSDSDSTSTGDPTGGPDTSTSGAEASASSEASSGTTTTMTTTTTKETGTTMEEPVCGDQVVDPGEECDDGNDNDDDGCKQCWRDRIVFATSEEYQGFKIGGLMEADQRCRMKAAQVGLPNVLTYKAWLSDSKSSAADRMLHAKGRYVLVNGLVVAADWDALISGTLENPINVTEKSETSIGSRVWTGTLANGQPAFGSTFCGDWDDEDADIEEGGTGIRKQTDSGWSFYSMGDCGSIAVLYCFEN